jgi:2'-5' RNA ligase
MKTGLTGTNRQELTVTGEISKPLFVSIPVPSAVTKVLSSIVQNNKELPDFRWIPEENYHITLFYIGRMKTTLIPGVQSALLHFFRSFPSFKLTFNEIAIVQNNGRNNMIWARFAENINFELCACKIRKVLLSLTELDPFFQKPVPHITLARFNHTAALHEISLSIKENRLPIPVRYCELRESNRIDNQVYYKKIETFYLGDYSIRGF